MTRNDIQTFFANVQKAWVARDVAALTSFHAPDGTLSSPMLGNRKGRTEIAASYEAAFRAFSEQSFQFEPLLIDGTRVSQPFTTTLVHTGEFMGLPATGRHAQIQGVFLYDMSPDGLIAHEQRLYDFTSLLIQIGALRAKPPR
jgi:steroid delta-isomerase-like uncharacterized protein